MKKISHLLPIALLLSCPIFAPAQEYVFETIELPAGFEFAAATDINNLGVVVGYQESEELDTRLFLWEDGIATFPQLDLELVLPFGINDAGTIIGSGVDEDSLGGSFDDLFFPSFSFTDGEVELFSFPEAFATFATGINNDGVIVGSFEGLEDDLVRSFINDGELFTELTLPDFNDAAVSGINDAGTMVGSVFDDEASAGFISRDGVSDVVIHPDGSSELISLNNTGLYVGIVFPSEGPMRGFVYDGEQFVDVAYPGAEETYVTGVNDVGVLVGSYYRNDQEFAFIARPVPEPSSQMLFSFGWLGSLVFRKRRSLLWRGQVQLHESPWQCVEATATHKPCPLTHLLVARRQQNNQKN